MAGTRKLGLVAQAVVCFGLVVWLGYDFVTAAALPPVSIALFDVVIAVCALIGLAGAVYGLRLKPSNPE